MKKLLLDHHEPTADELERTIASQIDTMPACGKRCTAKLEEGEKYAGVVLIASGKVCEVRCPKCEAKFDVPRKTLLARVFAKTPVRCFNCDPRRRRLGAPRKARPTTARARQVVELLGRGMALGDAALAIGMSHQAAEKLFFRWVVYPEWLALKERVEELEAQLAIAKRRNA
jgi:hypothetical protein